MTDVKSASVDHVSPVKVSGEGTSSPTSPQLGHAPPEVIADQENPVEEIEKGKKGWFAYLKTRNFYIVLVLGYDGPPCRPETIVANSPPECDMIADENSPSEETIDKSSRCR